MNELGPHITTNSGLPFYPLHPRRQDVRVADIAHALSHLCRFTGHTEVFYSVAQHSVFVSRLVPEKFALWGLLHDASEAYIGDVSSPLKSLLQDYRYIEHGVEQCVWGAFGLTGKLPPEVKAADVQAYEFERTAYFDRCLFGRARAWPPREAREEFMNRYRELVTYRVAA
jgi:hypothetical protein